MKKIKGFICEDCGHKFIYPKEVTENLGFAENPYWETEYLCPKCKSECIDEAEIEMTPEVIEQEESRRQMIEDEERYISYMMSQCRW